MKIIKYLSYLATSKFNQNQKDSQYPNFNGNNNFKPNLNVSLQQNQSNNNN